MKRLGLFLLGTAMLAVVLAVGFVPRVTHEAGAPSEPDSYTVEELRHDPEHAWTQTTRVTDDEDWIVEARNSDGKAARFYVPHEAYEGLSVGQEIRDVPIIWETNDPDTYALIECVDPRDDHLSP